MFYFYFLFTCPPREDITIQRPNWQIYIFKKCLYRHRRSSNSERNILIAFLTPVMPEMDHGSLVRWILMSFDSARISIRVETLS